MFFLFLTVLIFSIDQVSKEIALKSGIFVYRNFGITGGIFPGNAPVILIYRIITHLLIFLLIRYYFVTRGKKDLLTTLSLSFILGGSLGNTVDRISRGYVPDFISLSEVASIWPTTWYNNLADVFIVTGIITLLLLYLRRSGGHEERSR